MSFLVFRIVCHNKELILDEFNTCDTAQRWFWFHPSKRWQSDAGGRQYRYQELSWLISGLFNNISQVSVAHYWQLVGKWSLLFALNICVHSAPKSNVSAEWVAFIRSVKFEVHGDTFDDKKIIIIIKLYITHNSDIFPKTSTDSMVDTR